MGRRLCTIFDLLHPDLSDKVKQKQSKILQPHQKACNFSTGDKIYAKNYLGSPSWVPGTIVKVTGPLSYHVVTKNGIEIHRHADQLHPRSLKTPTPLIQISEKEKDIPDDDFHFPIRTPLRTYTTGQPSLPSRALSPTPTVPLCRSN